MPELVHKCPLCGNQQNKVFDQRIFRGQTVINRLCSTCGFVYMSPRFSEAELADFYEQEYRRVYQGTAGPTQKDLTVQSGRAKSLVKFWEVNFGRGGRRPPRRSSPRQRPLSRYLDIGCSAGLLLHVFQARYGCQVVGVEPGEAYRIYSKNQGLMVYPDLEAMQAAREAPFDLISMAHVLEHMPDPVEYLEYLRKKILTSDGWLLIEVPNLYSHDCFEIAHMCSFSEHTLSEVLKKAGFRVVRSRKHGQPRSAILPLYLTVLARPWEAHLRKIRRIGGQKHVDMSGKMDRQDQSSAIVETNQVYPERNVHIKRRLGMLRSRILKRLLPHLAWLPVGDVNAK